jgi:transcriptional regulator with XRE-family HTH domain
MTPAELVKTTRERKRLSQRRLALRAGTSQSAIARIERGDEEVTWPRLRSLMLAIARLESGLAFNKLASELAAAAPRGHRGRTA